MTDKTADQWVKIAYSIPGPGAFQKTFQQAMDSEYARGRAVALEQASKHMAQYGDACPDASYPSAPEFYRYAKEIRNIADKEPK